MGVTTVVVKRRPRRPAPEMPTGDIRVPPPPEVPPLTVSRWGLAITALPMLAGTVATALLFAGRSGGAYSYLVGAVFGLSSLGMLATSFGTYGVLPKRAEMIAARRAYLRQLASLRERVRATADRQRTALHYRHPEPEQLWSIVDSYRLWERRPGDADFAVARVGTGPQTLATALIPPTTRPLTELDPMTAVALQRFLATYAVVPDLPVAVALRGFALVYLRGAGSRGLLRALLAQLAVAHAPDEVLIAACTAPEHRAEWEYLKWLPHALHPTRVDALGPVRLVTESAGELESLLADVLGSRPRYGTGTEPAGPHLVVVLDDGDLTGSQHLAAEGGLAGMTLIDLSGTPPRVPDRSTIVLTVAEDGRLHSRSAEENGAVGRADDLDAASALALARQLSGRRPAPVGRGGDAPAAGDTGLAELLGLGDPAQLQVEQAWAPRAARDRLRLPIGVGTDGQPVELDLKESAQDGMGPHGLLIGATGSGKSELLRTLILGLAATHDSETLNFVLVDYKGGATFASLDRLPHTAAVITNLVEQQELVDRMQEALNGELVRRQELLRRAGNFASLRDYTKARAGGATLTPLPDLFIVCDEFSELITARPDFVDLFVQIGRLGRSLGVHLLLASQRLEEGRLRGLETYLSYRLCLRTFSALESRVALGVPDAFALPRAPGHGFLRYGTEPLVQFRGAYVSGPYHRPVLSDVDSADPYGRRVLDYTTRPVAATAPPVPAPAESTVDSETLLDVLVERLAGAGAPAHQVWLPPLSGSATLDELLGPPVTDPVRGLTIGNPELRGALQVPVALVDKPFEQRRDLFWLALDTAAGHVAIVGGVRSGKSTLLRTVLCGLSLTHTPAEVQFYCLDFGGGGLSAVRDLPHVGGVAGRADDAAVRRSVGEVAALLAAREQRFATDNIDSIATYRRRGFPRDGYGDVFLVVDGWATLRGEYPDLEPVLTDIATRGLSYGVHVLATATRWTDFRPAIRDLFGSRLELRLGDPADSLVSRRTAMYVPLDRPGRGLTADGLHFLAARPDLGGEADLVPAVAAAWSGPPAPPVRLLPDLVPYPLELDGDGLRWPIGLAEADLGPVRLDFAAEPHFLLFGDAESGKSSFLRALATSITRRYAPEQARLILVDYRRSLLGAVDSPHLIGYGTAASATADLIESAASYLRRRLPGPEVDAERLRARDWWTGPELFVLVDDYDLVAAGPTNPLTPLLEHLAQARDIGLHLVLARRSGGAARSLYEPLIQRLRELSSPGLVLSGDRDEGPLLGTVRPQPLPPGRGWLVTRRDGVRLIQLLYLAPGESLTPS